MRNLVNLFGYLPLRTMLEEVFLNNMPEDCLRENSRIDNNNSTLNTKELDLSSPLNIGGH